MNSTSVNLLTRLKKPQADEAWERFVDLYAPLIFHWARSHGLRTNDAADLAQDVFTTLVSKLPTFEYDPNQRFRAWLKTITLNRARDWQRRHACQETPGDPCFTEQITAPDAADPFEEEEYRQLLVRRAREVMETEFESTTWQACWLSVTEGLSAADVARQTGLTENAVRVAKCRVLRKLRSELQGMLE